MPSMTGGQALVRSLKAEGVEVVFALPGVQIMEVFDALYDHREIRLISVRHEQATTYMADGYAKALGKVGVALVVPGPGALNASAGLGTAYASSSPVLLVSGQIDSASLGKRRGALHEVDDQLDVFKPITKWNHRVLKVEEIPDAVHEAMHQMKTGRPRPVELEIPPDVLGAVGEAEIIEPEEYPGTPPDPQSIQEAADLLLSAQRPVILAGGGTILAGASQELLGVAEFLQAPVVTTPQGKGIIPENHYLSLGANSYGLGPAYEVLPQSDVILAVGTRFAMPYLELKESQQVVHIDADESEIGKNWPTSVGIAADARVALGSLLERLRAGGAPRASASVDLGAFRARSRQEIEALAPTQVAMVEALGQALDDDAIVVSGLTNVAYWSSVAYTTRYPRTYLTSSYFGTLGYALPAALGAKVAQPDRQVVALCGDGGFMYGPQELATAVQHGINVVAIVFNNGAFGASNYDQQVRFKGRFIGTELHNPDFVKLAEAFGAVGMRASPEELGLALKQALAVQKPVVLEVQLPVLEPPFQVRRRQG